LLGDALAQRTLERDDTADRAGWRPGMKWEEDR
jgi:hypothetical protein